MSIEAIADEFFPAIDNDDPRYGRWLGYRCRHCNAAGIGGPRLVLLGIDREKADATATAIASVSAVRRSGRLDVEAALICV